MQGYSPKPSKRARFSNEKPMPSVTKPVKRGEIQKEHSHAVHEKPIKKKNAHVQTDEQGWAELDQPVEEGFGAKIDLGYDLEAQERCGFLEAEYERCRNEKNQMLH